MRSLLVLALLAFSCGKDEKKKKDPTPDDRKEELQTL